MNRYTQLAIAATALSGLLLPTVSSASYYLYIYIHNNSGATLTVSGITKDNGSDLRHSGTRIDTSTTIPTGPNYYKIYSWQKFMGFRPKGTFTLKDGKGNTCTYSYDASAETNKSSATGGSFCVAGKMTVSTKEDASNLDVYFQ